ncbi:toll/interleukin-1 receptor domain-containing protein [Paenibacillus planticolens]|uniref:TIR domain-containing protein n=1 Tax=Paenibacillus planticolens TaxID=2654976 RepID=A0ABX1ZN32_9BACL|nr:toll/interleukin-1 receptor domain-containing protein [Paenibacillus planticolens]NOV01356.1 TIR domain-containing protein [Paenibacillus planticolens]
MKIFISWSGERSRKIAELLHEWIKCVLQASKPWVSSKDIERGSLWFTEINEQLVDTTVGIICITQGNKNKPWILFEAGALARGLSANRVCTFLIDLEPSDLVDPLAQFNHTFPNRTSVLALVKTINNSMKENQLDNGILEKVFNTYWGQFETDFNEILKQYPENITEAPRSEQDILLEILNSTRGLERRLRLVENEASGKPKKARESELNSLHGYHAARELAYALAKAGTRLYDIYTTLKDNLNLPNYALDQIMTDVAAGSITDNNSIEDNR